MKREKAQLVIKNVRIFNVFTGETEEGEIAIKDGRIAGIGSGYSAEETFDGGGNIVLPGFIDSHIHIESSMLSPEEFASLSVAHGTSAVIADPHELVNVCGIAGADYLREALDQLKYKGVSPLELFLQLPSCVPATPFETSGANIDAAETELEFSKGKFFGLGEVMNFPAVISGEEEVLKKIQSAKKRGAPVDGHAPGVRGDALNAYLCAGISTDHESLTSEECREKIARGMYVQIRCGSSTNNLEEAVKAVDGFNFSRFLLCSDDKNASDLLQRGHIDDALRRLVEAGYPAKYAVLAATKNICDCYSLKDRGAVAPHYFADLVLVDNLENFGVLAVFKRGVKVAERGHALFDSGSRYLPSSVTDTVHIRPVKKEDFRIMGHGGRFRALQVMPNGLYTEEVFLPAPKGELILKRDGTLCKLAVIERHFASGNMGLGLVKDYGLKGGAIGISVAHDSHNLVILGDSDEDMARALELLRKSGGGMALVSNGEERVFPLEIAGLMSQKSAQEVAKATAELSRLGHQMGVRDCYEPFMTLAFLSLAVIPKLKLTDRGLFSLEQYKIVPLEEV